jgi:ABC-2 type transport system ATP-binding protein
VRALRERSGTTVVLTTHYLDEADSLAERVVVIDHGAVVADATPEVLKAVHAADRMRLGFGGPDGARLAAARISSAHHDAKVSVVGALVHVEMTGATAAVPGLLADLLAVGAPALSAEVARPTLDDVFLALTGRSLREGGSSGASPAEPAPGEPDVRQEVAA